eukprot:TRINITY_DN18566_c0_g1_i1.p1 TRINITY_DN18566_c0_g1~~TRINITY_DN18566_c0_g1_i1.p1  ORF type:complete len:347 (-),score=109.26 TRINITY_DN18566_c0_g1_i1:55-1014(-)
MQEMKDPLVGAASSAASSVKGAASSAKASTARLEELASTVKSRATSAAQAASGYASGYAVAAGAAVKNGVQAASSAVKSGAMAAETAVKQGVCIAREVETAVKQGVDTAKGKLDAVLAPKCPGYTKTATDDKVEQLIAMGFGRRAALLALEREGHDVSRAVSALCRARTKQQRRAQQQAEMEERHHLALVNGFVEEAMMREEFEFQCAVLQSLNVQALDELEELQLLQLLYDTSPAAQAFSQPARSSPPKNHFLPSTATWLMPLPLKLKQEEQQLIGQEQEPAQQHASSEAEVVQAETPKAEAEEAASPRRPRLARCGA